MSLQKFCQSAILSNINLHDYVPQKKFYKFRLGGAGTFEQKDIELEKKAKAINDAILELALGTYKVEQLDNLKMGVMEVILLLKTNTYEADKKNWIYSSVGYPDQTLASLEELHQKITSFQKKNDSLSKLNGLQLELFTWITNARIQEQFKLAAAPAGDGSYNGFLARRKTAHIYTQIAQYIKTGENSSAPSNLLQFASHDEHLYVNDELKNKIEQERAKKSIIEYRNLLNIEKSNYFTFHKKRKETKLQQIDAIIDAIEKNDGIDNAITQFKTNDDANAGFQIGFFSIKKSRATEQVEAIDAVFNKIKNA